MKDRITNAGILFVTVCLFSGLAWLLSMGLYALGLWPLGALLRVLIVGFATYGLYWVGRHLLESEDARILKDIERMRERRS